MAARGAGSSTMSCSSSSWTIGAGLETSVGPPGSSEMSSCSIVLSIVSTKNGLPLCLFVVAVVSRGVVRCLLLEHCFDCCCWHGCMNFHGTRPMCVWHQGERGMEHCPQCGGRRLDWWRFHAGPWEPELVAVLGQEHVNHRDDGDCGADGKAVVLVVVPQPHHLFFFSARLIGFVVHYLHLQFISPRFLVARSKLVGCEAFHWELCGLLLPTILSKGLAFDRGRLA